MVFDVSILNEIIDIFHYSPFFLLLEARHYTLCYKQFCIMCVILFFNTFFLHVINC